MTASEARPPALSKEERALFLADTARDVTEYAVAPIRVLGFVFLIEFFVLALFETPSDFIGLAIELVSSSLLIAFPRWIAGLPGGNWRRLYAGYVLMVMLSCYEHHVIEGSDYISNGLHVLILASAFFVRQARDVLWVTLPATLIGAVTLRFWSAPPHALIFFAYFSISVLIGTYFCARLLEQTRLRGFLTRQRLDLLARHDSLTELPNRRCLDEILAVEMEHFQRQGEVFSLALIDLDRFKGVNDRYGHAAGDQVLIFASQRLRQATRLGDAVGRWGGEEFLVVMRGQSREQAMIAAERIRSLVAAEPLDLEGIGRIGLRASIGVATAMQGDSINQLVARADQALYHAKECGRDKAFHSEDLLANLKA